jgi:hypothetical protein
VRIAHAHREDAAVAVDVLLVEAVDRLLVEGIAARRRADVARPLGERELGAVGVDARAEVDGARVEQLRDLGVAAVAGEQLVEVVEDRRSTPSARRRGCCRRTRTPACRRPGRFRCW